MRWTRPQQSRLSAEAGGPAGRSRDECRWGGPWGFALCFHACPPPRHSFFQGVFPGGVTVTSLAWAAVRPAGHRRGGTGRIVSSPTPLRGSRVFRPFACGFQDCEPLPPQARPADDVTRLSSYGESETSLIQSTPPPPPSPRGGSRRTPGTHAVGRVVLSTKPRRSQVFGGCARVCQLQIFITET